MSVPIAAGARSRHLNCKGGPSDAPLVDVRTPIGANVGASHTALGGDHPASKDRTGVSSDSQSAFMVALRWQRPESQ